MQKGDHLCMYISLPTPQWGSCAFSDIQECKIQLFVFIYISITIYLPWKGYVQI